MKEETISEIRSGVTTLLGEFADAETDHSPWEEEAAPLLKELLSLIESPIERSQLQDWTERFERFLAENRIKGLYILPEMVKDLLKEDS